MDRAVFSVELVALKIAMDAKVHMWMNMFQIVNSERAQKKETLIFVVFVKTIHVKNWMSSWMIHGLTIGPWRLILHSSWITESMSGSKPKSRNGPARAAVLRYCGIKRNAPAESNLKHGTFRTDRQGCLPLRARAPDRKIFSHGWTRILPHIDFCDMPAWYLTIKQLVNHSILINYFLDICI